MIYINQETPENGKIEYLTDLAHPDSEFATAGNIDMAGCGICSVCMMLDDLLGLRLPLEEVVQYSYQTKANMEPGTKMELLGPFIAEKFGLKLEMTGDGQAFLDCIRNGGCAIINVGGDRDGHKGIFCHMGHFIVSPGVNEHGIIIYDPARGEDQYKNIPGIYEESGADYICSNMELILADIENRSPPFYLFTKSS